MTLNIHVHVHVHHHNGETEKILDSLSLITKQLNKMANTLDDVLAAVQNETTVENSLISLVGSIKAQLDAALSGQLTPDQQAKVDAIFAAVNTNSANVAAAVTANTPASTPPATGDSTGNAGDGTGNGN